MQASSIPSKIQLPFAHSGTKNTIPVASQIGITAGAASFTDGFPPLTFTPISAGGVPPAGGDFNGILNAITAVQQWQSAGGIFKWDSAFATAIGGYPAGAILQSSANTISWLNLADNNSTNPDATDGSAANWASLGAYGIGAVTGLTNANVTLLPSQFGYPIITLSGALTGNVQIIFPTLTNRWVVVNNTTGAFTVTCKTATGTGNTIAQGTLQEFWGDGTNLYSFGIGALSIPMDTTSITATVSSNALTTTFVAPTSNAPNVLMFRNPSLISGAPSSVQITTNYSITVPSGATLGTVSGHTARLYFAVAYNGGTPVLCVCNGFVDETALQSPTTISAASNSANVIYSASAVSASSPVRVIGFCDINEATAGTWATGPTLVQGAGGAALNGMYGPSSFGGYNLNNYVRLPSGLIIQLATGVASTTESSQTINFPIAFPTACIAVIPATYGAASAGADGMYQIGSTPTLTGVSVFSQYFSSNYSTITPTILALGY